MWRCWWWRRWLGARHSSLEQEEGHQLVYTLKSWSFTFTLEWNIIKCIKKPPEAFVLWFVLTVAVTVVSFVTDVIIVDFVFEVVSFPFAKAELLPDGFRREQTRPRHHVAAYVVTGGNTCQRWRHIIIIIIVVSHQSKKNNNKKQQQLNLEDDDDDDDSMMIIIIFIETCETWFLFKLKVPCKLWVKYLGTCLNMWNVCAWRYVTLCWDICTFL